MRILGVTKLWDKLRKDNWTTFRYKRADRDWSPGEIVKVVYKPRRKGGGVILGIAEILKVEPRLVIMPDESPMIDIIHKGKYDSVLFVSDQEAILDGFESRAEFVKWFGNRRLFEPINKLTIKWTQVWLYQGKDPEVDKQWARERGIEGKPMRIIKSGYISPVLFENGILRECGIEPLILTFGVHSWNIRS